MKPILHMVGRLDFGRLYDDEKASIFGGIEYFTPVPNLSSKTRV